MLTENMETRSDIVESFQQLSKQFSNQLAIGNHKETLSFAELNERVLFFRKQLRSLLSDSSTAIIAFALKNGPSALAIELAIWAEGHTALSLPDKPTCNEAEGYLSAVTPSLLILQSKEQTQWLQAASNIKGIGILLEEGEVLNSPNFGDIDSVHFDQDILQVQFTSGSSGTPKALAFSPQAVTAGILNTQEWYQEFPSDPAFSILPQYHAMGRALVFECLWSGRGLLTSDSMAFGEHKKSIAAHNCGLILSNPSYIRFGLQLKLWKSLSSIHRFILGTAPVEPELPVQIREQLPQAHLDIRYGVSEAFGALTRLSLPANSDLHSTGHVGAPLPLVEISTRHNEGSSPVLASSKALASFAIEANTIKPITVQDGFIETGDLGEYTKAKQLYLHGRSNVFLKHRGYRIDPVEIETSILSNTAVLETVVLGIPNKEVGEKIIALVEGNTLNTNELLQQCKEKLSGHKVPSKIIEVAKIPRNASDKLDRKAALHYLLSNYSF
ncbi:MAG: class I adenylate-forming enzyme family protein [Cellvibrionaceae bacterium]